MKTTIPRIPTSALISISLAIAGCASLENNPNNAAALNDVVNGVLSYTSGNTIGAAVDGAQGLSAFIWGLEGTKNSGAPVAVAAQTVQALPNAKNSTIVNIATALATATQTLTASGMTPDAATNLVAQTVYNAATKGTK
jgi:hypothetical protein